MIYNQYGKTSAQVSTVGFGGMQFDTSKSNSQNAELLLYAHSKGINYFDTAPGYCNDKSEDIFGIALKQMANTRDKWYVSTKRPPLPEDSANDIKKAVEKSLKRLNVDRIDFFHVWCIRKMSHYEEAMKKDGLYETLLKCKAEGMIDHIAISTHLPGQQVWQILEKNEFEAVLLGVNILNFLYRWQGVQAAYDTGIGVAAMNPLAGGLIPKYEKQLSFLADTGESPTEAALRFCISCPQITITLNGFTTKGHIDMACRVAENCKPFTQADIDRVKKHISESMNSICTGCGYCLKHCPQNIPIAGYMQCFNDKILFGTDDEKMVEKMKFHHEWGLVANRTASAADCTQCRQCEEACTQHLDIVERLRQIAEWEKQCDDYNTDKK